MRLSPCKRYIFRCGTDTSHLWDDAYRLLGHVNIPVQEFITIVAESEARVTRET